MLSNLMVCEMTLETTFYRVLYHLSMWYRCRKSDSFKTLYEQATKKYPTLDRKHEYTYKSLIRQGDAIEVALAIAEEKGPDMSFMTNMEKFKADFSLILFWIDSERESREYLQVSLRPPPFCLATAIILAPACVLAPEEVRLQFFDRFMHLENKWQSTEGRAIL